VKKKDEGMLLASAPLVGRGGGIIYIRRVVRAAEGGGT
jgi:hypothetical protein